MEAKKISPSQIVKILFPDAYKDIPEWILERAADFGKDLHESIQAYIEQPDLDNEIEEALIADNKIRLYNAFKQWFKEQEIKEPRTEYYLQTEDLHGYLDLVSFEDKRFWDYKFRNVDKKLDITKDIIQMMVYKLILKEITNEIFNWDLIIFDKKTAKVFIFNDQALTEEQKQLIEKLIKNTIDTIKQKQQLKAFTKEVLDDWKQ